MFASSLSLIGRAGPWTEAELLQARIDYAGSASLRSNLHNDSGNYGDLRQFKFANAVIVQAAGNDKIKADQDPSSWYCQKLIEVVDYVVNGNDIARNAAMRALKG